MSVPDLPVPGDLLRLSSPGQVLYPRSFSLSIGQGANAIQFVSPDLSGGAQEFRVQFKVERGDLQIPNSCDIRIFNADLTALQITANSPTGVSPEFSQIILNAGYAGTLGLIFKGNIKQVRNGRIDQKDSYTDITAGDGDEAYSFAVMAQAIAAGQATAGNEILNLLASMAAVAKQTSGTVPITGGYGADNQSLTYPSGAPPRAVVRYGMTKDIMRTWAANLGVTCSIQDGALQVCPLASYIPTAPVPVISVASGLIGVPEQTQNGLRVRTLLNPNIKIGQLVKLDAAAGINQYRYSLDRNDLQTNQVIAKVIKNSPDGTYYVMVANHTGDSRGQDWYTDLNLLAVDATVIPELLPDLFRFPYQGPVGGPASIT